jgi:hypothetical protein
MSLDPSAASTLPAAPITDLAHGLETAPPAASPDEVQAADHVFAQAHTGQTAAGLLGSWAGVLLLHDIVADSIVDDEDEEERPVLGDGVPQPT